MQIENRYIIEIITHTAQNLPTNVPPSRNLTSSTVLSLVAYQMLQYKHFSQK